MLSITLRGGTGQLFAPSWKFFGWFVVHLLFLGDNDSRWTKEPFKDRKTIACPSLQYSLCCFSNIHTYTPWHTWKIFFNFNESDGQLFRLVWQFYSHFVHDTFSSFCRKGKSRCSEETKWKKPFEEMQCSGSFRTVQLQCEMPASWRWLSTGMLRLEMCDSVASYLGEWWHQHSVGVAFSRVYLNLMMQILQVGSDYMAVNQREVCVCARVWMFVWWRRQNRHENWRETRDVMRKRVTLKTWRQPWKDEIHPPSPHHPS